MAMIEIEIVFDSVDGLIVYYNQSDSVAGEGAEEGDGL